MWGLTKLAHDFTEHMPKVKPAGRTEDADQPPAPQKPHFQITPAHLQVIDVVDDGYRLMRQMKK